MSQVRTPTRMFRPFGRLRPTGNPRRLRNASNSLARTLEDENRVSHSMQVSCFKWQGKFLGKQGHRRQIPFYIRFRKAGSGASPVCREPIELPYISDLNYIEILQPSLAPGGRHGED